MLFVWLLVFSFSFSFPFFFVVVVVVVLFVVGFFCHRCFLFFVTCVIAKPKNKSLPKLDRTFPFLCKPKPSVEGRGKKKGIFSSVSCQCSESFSYSPCEKVFSPSPVQIA